jgi:AICAR transformylase/IMP cyclohydrolase PurH
MISNRNPNSGITSNSVIYVINKVTFGLGTGERNRIGVAEITRNKTYRKLADRYCFEMHNRGLNNAIHAILLAVVNYFAFIILAFS